jgi:RNA polymerase sigma-70 factor (ECF subfamily)
MTDNPAASLELEKHRAYLLRFARAQLRDAGSAEDAVQETLLAALESPFAGRSGVRTWLVGILKHKIVDHLRRSAREQPLDPGDPECSPEDLDALFQADGHYAEPPLPWGSPDSALQQSRFFEALERCLERLPPNTARAFMMREVMGMGTDEICKALAVSPTNCWVLLYRARMALRVCLEKSWFASPSGSATK